MSTVVCRRGPASYPGEGLIFAVMERSILLELVGVAQLRFFGKSSYRRIVNLRKTLPPARVITLVDSCSLSVSTIVG
jgi:hypothetical protein